MNPEIKKKWIEALESGKYQQATGALKVDDGYCCLGVLCDLHRKQMKKKGWNNGRYLGDCYYLPDAVRNWAGLVKNNLKVCGSQLIALNDNGKSFLEIANFIRSKL
ncbi:MAG: hypothetical protein AABY07_01135 [Nanoarchaeota archaeon]